MGRFRKSSGSKQKTFKGAHRFEHWYRDNTVYFITSRCNNRFPALKSEHAKAIFWDRFEYYTKQYGFVVFVVTLLDNHYHFEGYLKHGENLGKMMRKLHGSIAKLVNDLLESEGQPRLLPFWRTRGQHDCFDGCIRDEKQCRLSYRYTLLQAVRHGISRDYREYPHTRVYVELERALKRAKELNALMEGVPYKRYERRGGP
jgi:hypothetical protein